jgi:IMP dehydrogenase
MAIYLDDVSRTFGEYLLIPGLTTKQCLPSNVSLKRRLSNINRRETCYRTEHTVRFGNHAIGLRTGTWPSNWHAMAVLSFIFGSQPIAIAGGNGPQSEKFKAGFVISDSNLTRTIHWQMSWN